MSIPYGEPKDCTAEAPMPAGAASYLWRHPFAKCTETEYDSLANGGSYDKYECPHCARTFWVELPD